MTCHSCQSACKRFGRHRNGLQRFCCKQCNKTYTEEHERPLEEMRLPVEKALSVLQLLLEGMSVRSTERITGVHRDTILKLLILAGSRSMQRMKQMIRNVPVEDVQADEIWGFCFKKERNRWEHEKDVYEIGDAWCYIAIERHTKLILAWHLGKRDPETTFKFIGKLRYATGEQRFQLTTDGLSLYKSAIGLQLHGYADYAQLVKIYSSPGEGEQRYSPADVVEAVPVPVMGLPRRERICTSHIERQNLSIRMGMRRMTRLTNGFSKKWGNLEVAYALWFAYYNFCRRHQTLRVTPAMESKLTDHVWSLAELLGV